MSLSDTFAGISGKPAAKKAATLVVENPPVVVKTGKRSDPDWKAFKVFLRKRTHKAVTVKLLQEDGGEVSELVEMLLAEWLKK